MSIEKYALCKPRLVLAYSVWDKMAGGGGRKEVGEGGEQGGGTSSTLGWVGFYRKLKVSGVFCLINIEFE